jgi:cob(I)alamin adenosyltransferase
VNIGLIDIEQIKELIKTRDPRVEIVLTGRGASEQLIELSDLATEVKCIKHPFDKGIAARKGIEF